MFGFKKKKSLLKYFDKVYILNYIGAKDRREFLKSQLKALGIENEVTWYYNCRYPWMNDEFLDFVRKYNFWKRYSNVWDHNTETKRCVHPLNIGNLNCVMGHYHILAEAYELGYNKILIIEDDASLLKNLSKIYDYFEHLPDDWDMIQCHYVPALNLPFKYKYGSDEYWKRETHVPLFCSTMNGYTHKGIEYVLKCKNNCFCNMDTHNAYVHLMDGNIKKYISREYLAIPSASIKSLCGGDNTYNGIHSINPDDYFED